MAQGPVYFFVFGNELPGVNMPIYEYQCESCGHQFDIIQKVSDDKLKICPKCNEPKLKKLVTAAGFKLKGTGWYETDFKTKEKKSSEKKLKT